ncbi:MAG TPA: acyloxyacyl hydrolase [Burkholderiales bacterium]|nr:acyloxyacyl hydrolase [Burkholderiales bacterium]
MNVFAKVALVTSSLLAIALFSSNSFATGTELGLVLGRSTKSQEADVVRFTYRRLLSESSEWWMPSAIQLGASIWRVPDLAGTTQRYDINATPVWRLEKSWGYVEGGIGAYLLSKTINTDEYHLPSSFEFGSHIGVGMRVGENGRIGVAFQHLSNAGLKQPNGGINFIELTGSIQF